MHIYIYIYIDMYIYIYIYILGLYCTIATTVFGFLQTDTYSQRLRRRFSKNCIGRFGAIFLKWSREVLF